MCVGIFAPGGPLTVDLLIATLQPLLHENHGSAIGFRQSFDFLVKNIGQRPIDRLVLLHPDNLFPDPREPLTKVKSYVGHDPWHGSNFFDSQPTVSPDAVEFELQAGGSDARIIRFTPSILNVLRARIHPAITDANRSSFMEHRGWPTPLELELEHPMEPYDPTNPHTVYFVRTSFHPPLVQHVAAHNHRMRNSTKNALHKRIFQLLDPDLIWVLFSGRLRQIGAEQVFAELITNGRSHPEHSVRIRDLRIGVQTENTSIPLDTHEIGEVGFLEAQTISRPAQSPRCQYVWLSGTEHYPADDPVTVAKQIWSYLDNAGTHAARTAEECTIAAGTSFRQNAVGVLSVLGRQGIVTETQPGSFTLTQEGRGVEFGLDWERDYRRRLSAAIGAAEIAIRRRPFRVLYSIGNFESDDKL